MLCPDSFQEGEFRLYVDRLVERHSHTTRLVLGVSDMVTADASWDRLLYITEKVDS